MYLAVATTALIADALLGEPGWLYRRVPHPVVLIGRLVTALETRLLDPADPPAAQRRAGILLLLVTLAVTAGAAALLQHLLLALPLGWLWTGLVASTLLAQRSLVQHVAAVAHALRQGLAQGREAVSRIVGRDPAQLDRHAVARAALESLAENVSDGVVAPAFWLVLGGLPGLAAYKAVNTLDSMVGHRTPHHLHLGWASARLDDLVNLVPARLSAGLILLGGSGFDLTKYRAGWAAVLRDAPRHRSPNAGWPETALAHLLGLRIAGPRVYDGELYAGAWMGDGSADATLEDILRGVALSWRAWWLLLGGMGLLRLL